MRFFKIILIVSILLLAFGIYSLKDDNQEVFTISDELLSYEDEIKKDKINSIYIFYMAKDEENIKELHLGYRNDEAAMHKLIEELSDIGIARLDNKEIIEFKEYRNEWGNKLTGTNQGKQNISSNKKEIIYQINPRDSSNYTGTLRIQDKITDEIIIFSTGDIVFKMPEEFGSIIPKDVLYTNTEDISEKVQEVMNIIDAAYFRRYPKIDS